MIPEIGTFALAVALFIGVALAVLPVVGAARGNVAWMQMARPAAQAQFVFVGVAFFCLMTSFINNDFSVVNVASNSNSALPLEYRIAATWGSHEGSLLLWVFMLSGWTAAVAIFSQRLPLRMVSDDAEVIEHCCTPLALSAQSLA